MTAGKPAARPFLLLGAVLFCLFVVIGIVRVVTRPKPPPGWQEYTLHEERCTVWMPGKPRNKRQDTAERQSPTDPNVRHLLIAQRIVPGRAFSVLYMFYTPYVRLRASAEQRFALFTPGLVGEGQRLLSETDISLQGCPGKEYRLRSTVNPFTSICRAYLVDESIYNVIYQFESADPSGREIPPEGKVFFQSFKFLPAAAKQSTW